MGGSDMVKSLTKMFNRIKNELSVPNQIQIADISCIYKGKGEKNNLENDRGIFGLARVKQILEKTMYNEIYPTIDLNMSDSNAGAGQQRNIRNHLPYPCE